MLLNAAQPVDFSFENAPTTTFFEIVNTQPEKRQNVVLHHVEKWTDIVHITRRSYVKHDMEARTVHLLSESKAAGKIHLHKLLANLCAYLPALFAWKVDTFGTAEAVRLRSDPLPLDNGIAPLLLPISSSAQASGKRDGYALSWRSPGVWEMLRAPCNGFQSIS